MFGKRHRTRKKNAKSTFQTRFSKMRDQIKQRSLEIKPRNEEKKRKLLESIKEDEKRLKKLNGKRNIREALIIQRRKKRKVQELKECQDSNEYRAFIEVVKPIVQPIKQENEKKKSNRILEFEKQQKYAIFMNAFHPDKVVPCFFDHYTCNSCLKNMDLMSLPEDSQMVCPYCGDVQEDLWNPMDYVEQKEGKSSGYDPTNLFTKFLSQFSVHAVDPPEEVFKIIQQHLYKIHINCREKAKSTPINDILRKSDLQKYVPMAQRISRIYQGLPIPQLTDEMIERTVKRFKQLTQVFSEVRVKQNRKKYPKFSYFAKICLEMDGYHEQAALFESHRTRAVLREADKRMKNCSKIWKSI